MRSAPFSSVHAVLTANRAPHGLGLERSCHNIVIQPSCYDTEGVDMDLHGQVVEPDHWHVETQAILKEHKRALKRQADEHNRALKRQAAHSAREKQDLEQKAARAALEIQVLEFQVAQTAEVASKAEREKQGLFEVQIRGRLYDIDLQARTQTNRSTRVVRAIRGTSSSWEYEDGSHGSGDWQQCDDATGRLLTKAHAAMTSSTRDPIPKHWKVPRTTGGEAAEFTVSLWCIAAFLADWVGLRPLNVTECSDCACLCEYHACRSTLRARKPPIS